MPFMYGQPSRGSASRSYSRRPNIEIVTPVPHVPDAPSPRYHHIPRRVVDVDVVDRSPSDYSPRTPRTPLLMLRDRPHSPASSISDEHDTQGELAYYYQRQLAHRPKPRYEEDNYQLALIPSGGNREIVRSHSSGAYVVDRVPTPERQKSTKKVTEAKVVERKQTLMLRDEKGNWTKIRRVVRS